MSYPRKRHYDTSRIMPEGAASTQSVVPELQAKTGKRSTLPLFLLATVVGVNLTADTIISKNSSDAARPWPSAEEPYGQGFDTGTDDPEPVPRPASSSPASSGGIGGGASRGPGYICEAAAKNPNIRAGVAAALGVEAAKITAESCRVISASGTGAAHGSWTKPGQANVSVNVIMTPAVVSGQDLHAGLQRAIQTNPSVANAWTLVNVRGADGAYCSKPAGSVSIFEDGYHLSVSAEGLGRDPQTGCPPQVVALGQTLVAENVA